jgi:hypothetical protein
MIEPCAANDSIGGKSSRVTYESHLVNNQNRNQKPNRTMTHPQNLNHILKTSCASRHLALLGFVVFFNSASANQVSFGSDNEGYGGFAAGASAIVPTPAPAWELTATAARFTNGPTADSGQVNSSLLKQYTLDRTEGSSCTITGVIDIVSTYAADNNRFGILIFATSGDLTGADTGLSLQHNLGNGQFRILNGGVNGSGVTTYNVAATYNGLNGASAIGTTFTYRAELTFVGTDIGVDFTLTDQNDFSQTLSTTVPAADFTGTYFGFGTRGRVRSTVPGTNDIPFIYDAKSYSVINVPAPSSGPFAFSILPNTMTPGNYDFTWTSQAGKEYDLVSSTDLSTAIATWPVWDGRTGLPATPPENVLAGVPGGGDTRRFFALVEKDAPPLFTENFDAAAELPAGWSRDGIVNGTDWDIGVPSGVPSGPATAFSVPNCAGTNIGGYYTENVDVSLITPAIAIPADRGATLRFRQLIDTDAAGDAGAVRVLDADNADAPIAGLALSGLQGEGSVGEGWTENTLILPALDVGGKNIKIEFNFVSDAGISQGIDVFGGFYVDDVVIALD